MPFFINGSDGEFPPVELAHKDGLLAVGGDLSYNRLMNAYRSGIFPWNNADEPICWYAPDPRFVLYPQEIKVSRSMKKVLNNNRFIFSIDTSFAEVIHNCRNAKGRGSDSTWITDEIEEAYTMLYNKGLAHSAETWMNGKLVGGLYGVQMGKVFFGESMFANETNASKFAFINYVKKLEKDGIVLIDCQVYTPHLESLGAKYISRKKFTAVLEELI